MRYNNPIDLCGVWSHGVANGYYGYSHDMRLVFLPDGRGSYCHDGWWRYRLYEFYWHVTPKEQIQFISIEATEDMQMNGYRFPRIVDSYSITMDDELQLAKLQIDELDDGFHLVCNDLELAKTYLTPDDGGYCGEPSVTLNGVS